MSKSNKAVKAKQEEIKEKLKDKLDHLFVEIFATGRRVDLRNLINFCENSGLTQKQAWQVVADLWVRHDHPSIKVEYGDILFWNDPEFGRMDGQGWFFCSGDSDYLGCCDPVRVYSLSARRQLLVAVHFALYPEPWHCPDSQCVWHFKSEHDDMEIPVGLFR